MKEYIKYTANDKMIDHKIFWNNVWNWISLGVMAGGLASLIGIFKELSIWL